MPGQFLLPNLTLLHFLDSEVHDMGGTVAFYRSIHVLFGPKLRTFMCHDMAVPLRHFGYAFEKLAEISPDLRNLNLSFGNWQSPSAPLICRTICKFHYLLCIFMDQLPISPEAFLHLARLPSLKIVELKMGFRNDDEYAPLLDKPEEQNYFPALSELYLIRQFGITMPTAALRAMHCPEQITVKVNAGEVTEGELHELCTVIASLKGVSCLKGLKVEIRRLCGLFTVATLEPLLALSHLRAVIVKASGHFAIDNYGLKTIAAAWPGIRRLELRPVYVPDAPKPLATLVGLVLLAHSCPELRVLGITLDTDPARVPLLYEFCRPGLGAEQCELAVLNVGLSKIEDPVPVAAFLSDLFPKLSAIECDLPTEHAAFEGFVGTEEERMAILAEAKHRERWRDVEFDYLPCFVQLRQQERRWARSHGRRILPPARVFASGAGGSMPTRIGDTLRQLTLRDTA